MKDDSPEGQPRLLSSPYRYPIGKAEASEERAEALEHLDFAIGEFRDMKMQPSLERALSHRDILKA